MAYLGRSTPEHHETYTAWKYPIEINPVDQMLSGAAGIAFYALSLI